MLLTLVYSLLTSVGYYLVWIYYDEVSCSTLHEHLEYFQFLKNNFYIYL